jgi:hypothetical protein
VAQHEELNVLGGGRATQQQDQPEHLLEIKYSNRNDTSGSCPTPDYRCSATQARLLAPHRMRCAGFAASGATAFGLVSAPMRLIAPHLTTGVNDLDDGGVWLPALGIALALADGGWAL